MHAQGRREAFFRLEAGNLAGERFTPDDGGKNGGVRSGSFEAVDLRIGPGRLGRSGRTQHDEISRRAQSLPDLGAEVARCRQLLSVTKDRRQMPWNRAVGSQPSDNRRRDPELLDAIVEPFGPARIDMAVAQEGVVKMRVRHRSAHVGGQHARAHRSLQLGKLDHRPRP